MASPSLLLRTKNYIWHPRFLCIDLEGQYSPSKVSEKYLVTPDQSETRDVRKADIRLQFLPQFKVSLNSYFNYGEMYSIRENLSNIRTKAMNTGSTVMFRHRYLPLSIGYTHTDEDQLEIQNGRRFINKQSSLEANTNQDFGKSYRQSLALSHNNYFRKDFNFYEIANIVDNAHFSNTILFGKNRTSSSAGFLSAVKQTGRDTFTRYQASEMLQLQLTPHLHWRNMAQYFSDRRPRHVLDQTRFGSSLQHQLFESLQTEALYEYNQSQNTTYEQHLQSTSVNLNYKKKVLGQHSVDMSYKYMINRQAWNSGDETIRILNEQLLLKDGEISLLSKFGIDINTLVIKNNTGTIIYQPNFDYLVIPQNEYVQIQRIRGGRIPDNTIVYVDYSAIQSGSYRYTSTNKNYSVALSLFNRTFTVYHRRNIQDYSDLYKTNSLTLNYYHQKIYGVKMEYRSISAGVEYDDNRKNTVLPYLLHRYYLRVQRTIRERIVVFANGSMNDYKQLGTEKNMLYSDLSGSASFSATRRLNFFASVSYMKQQGQRLNLDLLSYQARVNMMIYKMKLSMLYNHYDRSIFAERIRYNSINLEISRKF